ncbi:hypothetical protein AAMO2058_000353200 [Amorphochlora amoebiformis]
MANYSDMSELNEVLAMPIKSSLPTRWERKARERSKRDGDRFIPNRKAMNKDLMRIDREDLENRNPENQKFSSMVAQTILKSDSASKILSYRNKAPKPSDSHLNKLRVLYAANRETVRVRRQYRHINSTPERVLDAPDLEDDYYINVLSWSSQDILAVALGPVIYLWDAKSGSIETLCETESDEDIVTAVNFMHDGNHLAVGTTNKDVQIWDISRKKKIRSMKGHAARVGSLAWNNHVLSSGSRDTMIFNHDVRVANHHIHTYHGHTQEICGLTWSSDGTQLASGGNDNFCHIWNTSDSAPVHSFDHKAAVKALAWNPVQKSVLATGAGTADRHMRFFNTTSGKMINSIDTESQVCSIQWNREGKELVSAHGFSKNQLSVWSYPSMTRLADLQGHSSRILHTALSPDQTMVCSAAADETLRFWKVFEAPSRKRSAEHHSVPSSKRSIMRSIR